MEIFVKNGNFDQKWKFSSKMEIWAKNGNFDEKWKFHFAQIIFNIFLDEKWEIKIVKSIWKRLRKRARALYRN